MARLRIDQLFRPSRHTNDNHRGPHELRMTHMFNDRPFRMDRSLIISTTSRARPQLIRGDPQHLPSFNNKCHMGISHIGFHTTRCHTHMLLNQVTHILFIHAHFAFLCFLCPYSYKVINLYMVLAVHTVLIAILLRHDHRILRIRKGELRGIRAELGLNHGR
jgi:hypothetical protein